METMIPTQAKSGGAAHTSLPSVPSRQKGVYAFVYAMKAVMSSISSANKGNAAMLEATSSEADQVAEEYKNVKQASNLNGLQSEAGLQANLTQLEMIQTRANITQQKMGNYSLNIANGEQGILTASLNAKHLIDGFAQMGRTR